jgi:uncharacterized membrane protein
MRTARWALAAAAVLWAASLPLAAYAASHFAVESPSGFAALAIYAVGSVICHQRPERSYHFLTTQFPVCARCTGIYVGAALAAVVGARRSDDTAGRAGRAAPSEVGSRESRPTSIRTSPGLRLLSIAAIAPAALTLAYEWLTGDMPSNTLRALTGVALGAVASWLVVRVALR